ncbi:MAG: flagellar hook-length control protein FliK, partial [Hyphomicrobiales bacterium]
GDLPLGFTETPAEELPEVEPADAPLPNPSRGPDPITVERVLAQRPTLPPQAANGLETAQANRPEHYSGLGLVTALTPNTVPLDPADAVQSDAEAATPEAAGDDIAGAPLTPALPETGWDIADGITPAVAAPADPAAASPAPPFADRSVIAPPTGVAQTVDGIPAAPVPPTAGLSVPPAPIDTVTAPPADPTLQARPSGAAPQTTPPTDQTQPGAIRTDSALSADADAPAPHASAAPKPAFRALDSSAGSKPDPGANPPGAPGAERNAPRPALITAFDTMAGGSQAQGANKSGPSAAPPAAPPGIALDPMSPAAAGSAAPASDPATAALPLAQNSHTISVRFGASPVPGPSAQMPVNTLAFNIARNFDNGVNRFEIRIDPPELGRVDVKLDMSVEGRVQAHLTVERSETLELMMRDARSLEKALADTGLNMSRDSLSFSLKDQNASGRGADNGGNETPDGGDLPGDDDPATETARGYITDSGVDITV